MPRPKKENRIAIFLGLLCIECSQAMPCQWHEFKSFMPSTELLHHSWNADATVRVPSYRDGAGGGGDDSVRMPKEPNSHKARPSAIAASNCYLLPLPMWRNSPAVFTRPLNPILPDLCVTDNWRTPKRKQSSLVAISLKTTHFQKQKWTDWVVA